MKKRKHHHVPFQQVRGTGSGSAHRRTGSASGGEVNLALDLNVDLNSRDDARYLNSEVTDVIRLLRQAGDPSEAPPPDLLPSLLARMPEYMELIRTGQSRRRRWTRLVRRVITPVRAVAVALIGGSFALLSMMVLGPGRVGVNLAHALEPVVLASHAAPGVHMIIQVRDRGVEDFDHVDPRADMVPMEVWMRWPEGREIGMKPREKAVAEKEKAEASGAGQPSGPAGADRGRIRVHKQGRIFNYDGTHSIHYWTASNEVLKETGGGPKFDVFWPAAWVANLVALPKGAEVLEQTEANGEGILRVRWPEPSPPPSSRSWFQDYEREVELRWSLETQQLTGLRRWITTRGGKVLVTETSSIQYMPSVGDEVFDISVPADARPRTIPPAPPEIDALGPREVAERFWNACIAGDWETVRIFCPSPEMIEWLQQARPYELRSLGEPFRKPPFIGVFVPYEVRFHAGPKKLKKNLALRNDNPYGRWVWDGGI